MFIFRVCVCFFLLNNHQHKTWMKHFTQMMMRRGHAKYLSAGFQWILWDNLFEPFGFLWLDHLALTVFLWTQHCVLFFLRPLNATFGNRNFSRKSFNKFHSFHLIKDNMKRRNRLFTDIIKSIECTISFGLKSARRDAFVIGKT